MQYKVKYHGWEDRQAKVAENEALGYRMLHDDFPPEWKQGQEPRGIMTFTDKPPPQDLSPPKRNLEAEIDDLQTRLKALELKAGFLTIP